jgi:putative ABC transport system permease protein
LSRGIVLGVGASAGVARLLHALLYGVSGVDPIAHGIAVAILLLVAALANLVPALTAARVDPAERFVANDVRRSRIFDERSNVRR